MALILTALAVGMSNFGAAIAVGSAGVDGRTKRWILGSFLVFETGMPLMGVVLGDLLSRTLGGAGHWLAGLLLLTVGAASLLPERRREGVSLVGLTPRRIVFGALVLSLDNLAVGFALVAFGVPLLAAAAVFGVVSVSLALVGFELGAHVARLVRNTDALAASVLIVVGLGVLAHLY
jgi:putative Mn2+ efflux pump MntP